MEFVLFKCQTSHLCLISLETKPVWKQIKY